MSNATEMTATAVMWDSITSNFGVIVSARGVKSYIVQGRGSALKHPKRVVLGRCSDMSLARARKRAEETLYSWGSALTRD